MKIKNKTLIGLSLSVITGAAMANVNYLNKENESYKIQLQGHVEIRPDYDVYFLDGFDNTKKKLTNIEEMGKTSICYLSAGSYENWREDRSKFNKEVIGKPLGEWPGEFWLDIRSENVKNIMRSRIQYMAEKGCQGLDPDNVNVHIQNSGFDITREDQIEYNKFLAKEIQKNGMKAGLKNALDLIPELVDHYDFSVNEECHVYNECNKLQPFVDANKPVYNIEYNYKFIKPNDIYKLCQESKEQGFNTVIAHLKLDDSYYRSCSKLIK